jgi:SseB protein N-terminal domain
MNEGIETLLNRIREEADDHLIEPFLDALFDSTLAVPIRTSFSELTRGVVYPNEFLSVLAVKASDEKITIPLFTRAELTLAWCGATLECRMMTWSSLLALVPDSWWICLNPGQEVEKEFSPWEIELFKKGRESLPEIAEELRESLRDEDANALETFSASPLPGNLFREEVDIIKKVARSFAGIESIALLLQSNSETQSEKSSSHTTLLVRLGSATLSPSEAAFTCQACSLEIQRKLIGRPVTVRCFPSSYEGVDLAHGLFKDARQERII